MWRPIPLDDADVVDTPKERPRDASWARAVATALLLLLLAAAALVSPTTKQFLRWLAPAPSTSPSEADGRPPLLLLLGVQLLASVSDLLVGSAARQSTPRRTLLARTLVSSAQTLLIGVVLQLGAPQLTSRRYKGREQLPCALESACAPQGPLWVPASLLAHPLLLANGLLALGYHVSELAILRHAWGAVLKPSAGLGSVLFVGPIAAYLGLPDEAPRRAALLCAFGGLLCTAWEPRRTPARGAATVPAPAAPARVGEVDTGGDAQRSTDAADDDGEDHEPASGAARLLQLLLPMVVLATCTALWNVWQRLFNDRFGVNVWGYLALDQGAAPLYVLSFAAAVDASPLRARMLAPADRAESFGAALRGCWRGDGEDGTAGGADRRWRMAVGVALSNARVAIYFWLFISYSMSQTFFMMSVLRIGCSGLFSLAAARLAPHSVALSAAEQSRMLAPRTLLPKLAGTCLVVGALVLA